MVDYALPDGRRHRAGPSRDIQGIGAWIRTLEGVRGTSDVGGGGHTRFMLTYASEGANPAFGQILVDVDDYTRIDPLIPRIVEHIEDIHPDGRAKVWKFVLGPGGDSLIEARFSGPDPVVLRRLAERAKAVYAREGALAIQDDWGEMVKNLSSAHQ